MRLLCRRRYAAAMLSIKKCAAFVLAPLVLAAAPAPAPVQYYAAALAVMRALPQPAKIAVSVTASTNGLGIYAGPSQSDPKMATFRAGSGYSQTSTAWSETFYPASDTATVDTETAKTLLGEGPLFDPTWTGAYDWLRYGLDGRPHQNAAQTAPKPDPQLKTIATLTVMAPGAYRVTDAGAQACPDGSAGHHLQFAAKADWTRHPLTDITVDERTLRFCEVVLRIDPQHVHGGTATVELDYADVNGYWLETHNHIDFLARLFGIGVRHLSIDANYHVTKVQ